MPVARVQSALAATATAVWRSSTLVSWVSLLVRIGGLAVLLPLVIVRFSVEEVLIWQMLSSLTLMVSYIDFGFGPTFTRLVAFGRGGGTMAGIQQPKAPRAEPSDDASSQSLDLAAILGTQRVVYCSLALAATAIAAVAGTAALWCPIALLDNPAEGWVAWGLTLASAVLALLTTLYSSIVIGFDRIVELRRVEIVVGAFQLLVASLIIASGLGLVALIVCYLAANLAMFCLSAWLARRHTRHLAQRFEMRVFQAVWPGAWRSGVGILMASGTVQASGLLFAQLASPAASASYLIVLRLVSVLGQLANAPFYTKLPRLSVLRAKGDTAAVRTLAAKGFRLTAWTYVVGALSLVWLGPPLLAMIKSSVPMPPADLTILLVLSQYIERYSATHLQIYSTTNHIVWHLAAGITGLLMIVLMLVLVPLIGPVGVPTAMIVGYLAFYAGYASHLSLKSMSVSRLTFDGRTVFAPTAILLLGLGAWLTFHHVARP